MASRIKHIKRSKRSYRSNIPVHMLKANARTVAEQKYLRDLAKINLTRDDEVTK